MFKLFIYQISFRFFYGYIHTSRTHMPCTHCTGACVGYAAQADACLLYVSVYTYKLSKVAQASPCPAPNNP